MSTLASTAFSFAMIKGEKKEKNLLNFLNFYLCNLTDPNGENEAVTQHMILHNWTHLKLQSSSITSPAVWPWF